MARLLVLGDSLTFHGPQRPELLTHPGLWPNVAAAATGAASDVVARAGWTSRDGWWAVTADPRVWTSLADPATVGFVLAVGGMDQLPASLPVWLRESIRYVRPGPLRRRVRAGYHAAHPHVVRGTGGRARQLSPAATTHYWGRIVHAVRHHRPTLPIVLLAPAPSRSASYPVVPGHEAAVRAAAAFGREHGVPVIDLDPLVGPMHAAGRGNPDGLHWDWPTHEAVGRAVAAAVLPPG